MVRRSATACRLAERLGPDVEGREQPLDIAFARAEAPQERDERRRIRRLHRAEAPEAPARERRAEGAASRVRHGPEARGAVGDDDADEAAALAFRADARRADLRPPAVKVGRHKLEKLALVDRAAVELEVDVHMRR